MSLANRIKQYKFFMENGNKELAEQQLKSPSIQEKGINLLEHIEQEDNSETKSKRKK